MLLFLLIRKQEVEALEYLLALLGVIFRFGIIFAIHIQLLNGGEE